MSKFWGYYQGKSLFSDGVRVKAPLPDADIETKKAWLKNKIKDKYTKEQTGFSDAEKTFMKEYFTEDEINQIKPKSTFLKHLFLGCLGLFISLKIIGKVHALFPIISTFLISILLWNILKAPILYIWWTYFASQVAFSRHPNIVEVGDATSHSRFTLWFRDYILAPFIVCLFTSYIFNVGFFYQKIDLEKSSTKTNLGIYTDQCTECDNCTKKSFANSMKVMGGSVQDACELCCESANMNY